MANIQFSSAKNYKTKTKDHLLSFSGSDVVARIGWTKPSKLIRFDENLNEKWKNIIDGRVRDIKSDEYGTIAAESTYLKNQTGEGFLSSLYVIDNYGKTTKILDKIAGFIVLEGISSEKILVWNDISLTINCLNRNNGDQTWSRSYHDLIDTKYNMRIIHYAQELDKILTVRISNSRDKFLIPSIISVLDGYGNIISELSDGFPPDKESSNKERDVGSGFSISIALPTHYPIYHAFFINNGNSILTAYYNGQVACWSVNGALEWVFNCKNKVRPGLSVTSDGLISALCENGDYYLIENGHKIFHSKIDFDYRKSYQVSSAGKYAILIFDNKIHFFQRIGKVGELEFQEKIRSVAYDPKEQLLAISAENLALP